MVFLVICLWLTSRDVGRLKPSGCINRAGDCPEIGAFEY